MWKYKIVELYCGIYWDYDQRCNKYLYRINTFKDFPNDAEEVENPEYDPAFPRPTPPEFCKRMVGVDCLKNNCAYVTYCDGSAEPDESDLE